MLEISKNINTWDLFLKDSILIVWNGTWCQCFSKLPLMILRCMWGWGPLVEALKTQSPCPAGLKISGKCLTADSFLWETLHTEYSSSPPPWISGETIFFSTSWISQALGNWQKKELALSWLKNHIREKQETLHSKEDVLVILSRNDVLSSWPPGEKLSDLKSLPSFLHPWAWAFLSSLFSQGNSAKENSDELCNVGGNLERKKRIGYLNLSAIFQSKHMSAFFFYTFGCFRDGGVDIFEIV